MISQLVDTVVVNSIFLSFGLGLPWDIVAKIIVAAYVFKLVFAAIDTPFIYLGVALLGRYIGADAVKWRLKRFYKISRTLASVRTYRKSGYRYPFGSRRRSA